MVNALRRVFSGAKALLALMPAFLGLLPSLGGARFSAPIVDELSDNDITINVRRLAGEDGTGKKEVKKYDEVDMAQMSLFDTVRDDDIINELKEMDVDRMTPMEALNTLNRLKNTINNRWQNG